MKSNHVKLNGRQPVLTESARGHACTGRGSLSPRPPDYPLRGDIARKNRRTETWRQWRTFGSCSTIGIEAKLRERKNMLNDKIKLIVLLCFSAFSFSNAGAFSYSRIELSINGISREAIAAIPENAKTEKSPIIIAFHGHGGTMRNAAKKFECEKFWPEAIVVYPQGLKTPGGIVDPQGNYPGWQMNIGEQEDRDLAFFDALVDYVRTNYHIDEDRVYVVGHSNGGLFAYELWAARGNEIAAIASISAIIPVKTDRSKLKPMPIFHVAGRYDPLVRFEWQNESIDFIKALNQCGASGKGNDKNMDIYESKIGRPLVTYIHDGGHEVPEGAMPLIIDFFKENSKQ